MMTTHVRVSCAFFFIIPASQDDVSLSAIKKGVVKAGRRQIDEEADEEEEEEDEEEEEEEDEEDEEEEETNDKPEAAVATSELYVCHHCLMSRTQAGQACGD